LRRLVIHAIRGGFPSHLLNRLVAALIAFLSESNQILQINAPMSTHSVEVNLSFVKQPKLSALECGGQRRT
jgi:hypothetical protein